MTLILSILSIYAISSLVSNYNGPFDILRRIRNIKPLQELTECQVCLAFWVTLPFLFILSPLEALAAYGSVILLVRYEP